MRRSPAPRPSRACPGLYDSALVIAADGGTSGGGAFDTVDAPDFGDGTTLAVTYDAAGVRATRAFRGDTDLDGSVNLRDYIVTANTQGQQGTWTDGNFDDNSLVDRADLDDLVANFGPGTSDDPTASSDAVELAVNILTGEMTLRGDATLRALRIASATGSLDPQTGSFLDLFSDTLRLGSDAIILGDDGSGVLLQGAQTLASLFDLAGQQDLELAFGLVGDDDL
ncbi:MAG: hypothetical protein ACOC1G_07995, partial [Phycisphaeraceae bacterium]